MIVAGCAVRLNVSDLAANKFVVLAGTSLCKCQLCMGVLAQGMLFIMPQWFVDNWAIILTAAVAVVSLIVAIVALIRHNQ